MAINPEISVEALFAKASALAENADKRPEAREYCLQGLTQAPENLRLRLLLARLYYLDGYSEFMVRELLRLKELCGLSSIDKLLDGFGSIVSQFSSQSAKITPQRVMSSEDENPVEKDKEGGVLAEVDFETDLLDLLDEIEDKETEK